MQHVEMRQIQETLIEKVGMSASKIRQAGEAEIREIAQGGRDTSLETVNEYSRGVITTAKKHQSTRPKFANLQMGRAQGGNALYREQGDHAQS